MRVDQIKKINDEILDLTELIIKNKNREKILNERYFHHMFSTLLIEKLDLDWEETWEYVNISPEHPTERKFLWKKLDLENVEKTRKEVLDKKKRGHYEFYLDLEEDIYVEWKGPKLYSKEDIVQVMLKLLSNEKDSIKVFSAIILSSKTGRKDHMGSIEKRLKEGIEFSCKVLEIEDLDSQNLYVYVATIPDSGVKKIYWGKYTMEEE